MTTYNPINLPDTWLDHVADAFWAATNKVSENGRQSLLATCAGLLLAALAI